jgi:hypothetical protein
MKRVAGTGNGILKDSNCRYAEVLLVLDEGLDMFRLGNTAFDGNMNPSDNPSFAKIILVGWMSGRLPQTGWNRFG